VNTGGTTGGLESRALEEGVGILIRDAELLGQGAIRGRSPDDQARVVTPAEAVRLGAHYLVIGRPITQSPDPAATLESIRQSLQEGMAA